MPKAELGSSAPQLAPAGQCWLARPWLRWNAIPSLFTRYTEEENAIDYTKNSERTDRQRERETVHP